jgi:hypothetical protein
MNYKTIALYTLTGSLLLLAAYLKSSSVCFAAVMVFCTLEGITVAENVFTKAAKDAEIVSLVARAEAYEKKLKYLELEITNVAERAKTVLGEHY